MTVSPSPPSHALAIIPKEVLALASSPEVPDFLVLDQDDWDAAPVEMRAEAIMLYHRELEESARDIKPEFPKITSPSGEGSQWMMPDGSTLKEIEGIIVFKTAARGYWKSAKITHAPPDCASFDGKMSTDGKRPDGKPGDCAGCPMNQFGSDVKGGAGKGCKERINLFIWVGGTKIPYLLSIPPTGLRPFSRYVTGLLNMKPARPLTQITTVLALERKQGADASYAIVAPRVGRTLNYLEMMAGLKMRERFKEEMERRGVTEAEVTDEPSGAGRQPGDESPPPRTDTDRGNLGHDVDVPF